MKRINYPIHPDFKVWTKFNPPLNKLTIPIIQHLMCPLFYLEKSDTALKVDRYTIYTKAHKIPILIYTPKELLHKKSSCLIIYHGGGFVIPASIHHFKLAKEYALQVQCRVVFVNYSLAPKHPFPQAIFECFKTYEWVYKNADSLYIDSSRIAVGGDSAGGQLSSDVCISAKRKGLPVPCAQMLLYPACTYGIETESLKEFVDTPMCNSKDSDKYLDLYLPSKSFPHPEYLNLIDADLSFMPSTYIETAQYDCLRDGALLYADALKQNNVDIFLHKTEGTMHGYDIVLSSSIVKESISKRIEFLKTHLNK